MSGELQTGGSSILSPSAVKPSPTLWFTTEVQQMMYGLGDCRRPLAESASLVEEIVHQQMTQLLYQAEDAGRLRNARFLGIEDFLFLLRKDKVKLRRLIRFLTLKDAKYAVVKQVTEDDDASGDVSATELKAPPKKRQKICYDFLSTIDQTGELLMLFDDEYTDEVKHERALRAEMCTRNMDAGQYMDYCEARQASFTPRHKQQKFRDWLLSGISMDIKPNPMAMEVLSYLAYEIVAQVVDLTLLVKKACHVRSDDPFSVAMPPVCFNHEPVATETTTTGSVAAMLKSPTIGKTSPNSSPPATPTTPGGITTGPGLSLSINSQTSLSSSTSSVKSKSKKKKKGGSSSSREVFTSNAITPADIREAMRRHSQRVGPFADFSKAPVMSSSSNLLCF